MTAKQHRIQIIEWPRERAPQIVMHGARCSCGWQSVWQDTRKQAEHEGDDHVIAATRSED